MRSFTLAPCSLVAVLLSCGCSNPAQTATSPPDVPSVVGAWRSKVQFLDGPFAEVTDLEFLYAFNPGGTVTESSNYDGAPPVPPAYGAWRQTGPRSYEVKYVYFNTRPPATFAEMLDSGGWSPNGYGELVERLTLSDDKSTFESEITLQMFDRSGKPTEGGGRAAGRGVRIGF